MSDLIRVGVTQFPLHRAQGQEEVQAEVAVNFTFVLYTFRIGSGPRLCPTQLIWEIRSTRWGGRGRTVFLETDVRRQEIRGKSMRLRNVCVYVNVLGNRWPFRCLTFFLFCFSEYIFILDLSY